MSLSWLWCCWNNSVVPHTSVVSLKPMWTLWFARHFYGAPDTYLVFLTRLWFPWKVPGVPRQWCPWYICGVLILVCCSWNLCGVPDTYMVSLTCMWCPWNIYSFPGTSSYTSYHFLNVGTKRQKWLILAFSSLSTTLIWNASMYHVTKWPEVSVAPYFGYFGCDNGTYLWSQILILLPY